METSSIHKKSPYGEGTIFWSASMQMYIARYPATKCGLNRKVSGYGKTRAQAIANRDKALRKAIEGTQRKTRNLTKSVLKSYYTWLEESNRKPNTISEKQRRLDKYLKPYMTIGIASINEDDIALIIQNAKNEARNESNSRIANQIYSELNQLFNYCVKRKIINENPILLIEKPSYKSKAHQDNEFHIDDRIKLGKKLLAFAKNHMKEFGTMYGVLLIASLGLRAGEIRGLTWDCFTNLDNTDTTILYVKQQYLKNRSTHKNELVKWTKTDSGFRKLPFPDGWKNSLWEYIEWTLDKSNPHHFPSLEDYTNASGFCFTNKQGGPLNNDTLNRYWKKLKTAYEQERQKTDPNFKLTELDKSMRLYDMRHVCASLLISSGKVTIDQLRPILGHMDRRMTDYYTHLTMESEKLVMNRIPKAMGGGFQEDEYAI